jgi:putative transposase
MKKSRYTEEQIIGILKQHEAGVKTADLCRDQVRRWRNREFWADEVPANRNEYRQMMKEAEEEAERLPNRITEKEAFIGWLKGIDRSAPKLRSVPPPPAQQRKSGKRELLLTFEGLLKPSSENGDGREEMHFAV